MSRSINEIWNNQSPTYYFYMDRNSDLKKSVNFFKHAYLDRKNTSDWRFKLFLNVVKNTTKTYCSDSLYPSNGSSLY